MTTIFDAIRDKNIETVKILLISTFTPSVDLILLQPSYLSHISHISYHNQPISIVDSVIYNGQKQINK